MATFQADDSWTSSLIWGLQPCKLQFACRSQFYESERSLSNLSGLIEITPPSAVFAYKVVLANCGCS